jgi:hypothetical protein
MGDTPESLNLQDLARALGGRDYRGDRDGCIAAHNRAEVARASVYENQLAQ